VIDARATRPAAATVETEGAHEAYPGGSMGTRASLSPAEKTTTPKTMTPKTFRCPECYARVVAEPDDDAKTALWLHGLSGRCRAKQTPKAEKPRRKERLEAMLGEEWG
jgi:hypothetical protein